MPKFTVTVANTATITVGTSATAANTPVRRRCSFDPAELRRRAITNWPIFSPITVVRTRK